MSLEPVDHPSLTTATMAPTRTLLHVQYTPLSEYHLTTVTVVHILGMFTLFVANDFHCVGARGGGGARCVPLPKCLPLAVAIQHPRHPCFLLWGLSCMGCVNICQPSVTI